MWIAALIFLNVQFHIAKAMIFLAISPLMEPMVWAYRPDLDHSFPEDMWVRYAAAFPRMWAASAFKGKFCSSC